jgi:hypothetical protein
MNNFSPPVGVDIQKVIQSLPIAEVYKALATQAQGLTQAEAEERLQRLGRNDSG